MTALANPVYRRGEPVEWGLVSNAVITFLAVTVEKRDRRPYPVYVTHRQLRVLWYRGRGYRWANWISDIHFPRSARRSFQPVLFLNAWSADRLLVGLSPLDVVFAYSCRV